MISYAKAENKWVSVATKCSSPVRIYVETFSHVIFSQKRPQEQTTVTFDLKAIESLSTFARKKYVKKNAEIISFRLFSTKSALTKCQLTFNFHTKLANENFQFIVSDSHQQTKPADPSHQGIRFYMILLAGLSILIFLSTVIVGCLTSEGLSDDDDVVEMGKMTKVGHQFI
ncbi:hypothetical protein B9Z55_025275 [Caenorhabditis nigoni]|nr:hypothetical protein B9Z55_025275 [Caenorhabditis nigoni]